MVCLEKEREIAFAETKLPPSIAGESLVCMVWKSES